MGKIKPTRTGHSRLFPSNGEVRLVAHFLAGRMSLGMAGRLTGGAAGRACGLISAAESDRSIGAQAGAAVPRTRPRIDVPAGRCCNLRLEFPIPTTAITTQFVATPLLRVAFEVAGPADGFPVVLLHGWPDDVRTWDSMLPALHAAGFRTFAPWLRGYGPTRFLRDDTFRSGQLVALGQDLADFAIALGLGRHALVGHDWGARAAYIASALNEPRVAACVALSVGYGTNHPGQVFDYRQTQNYWYHWLMATPRGERLVREDRRAFTRHIWNEWFVAYKPDDAEFERTAVSFDNPDWADVTLHSYRARWGHAPGDPRYAKLEVRFDPAPKQRVPTLTLHGALDPVNSPRMSEGKEAYFAGHYERRLIAGAGHFPQRECVADVGQEIVDWLAQHR